MENMATSPAPTHRWYSRPVLFVADLGRSLRFYPDGNELFFPVPG